jgi:hypothetical protein
MNHAIFYFFPKYWDMFYPGFYIVFSRKYITRLAIRNKAPAILKSPELIESTAIIISAKATIASNSASMFVIFFPIGTRIRTTTHNKIWFVIGDAS